MNDFLGRSTPQKIVQILVFRSKCVSPEKICDAFSIAKRASKETSLGLSYHIITAKHGGRLLFRSPCEKAIAGTETGIGTEFEILLPLH